MLLLEMKKLWLSNTKWKTQKPVAKYLKWKNKKLVKNLKWKSETRLAEQLKSKAMHEEVEMKA